MSWTGILFWIIMILGWLSSIVASEEGEVRIGYCFIVTIFSFILSSQGYSFLLIFSLILFLPLIIINVITFFIAEDVFTRNKKD